MKLLLTVFITLTSSGAAWAGSEPYFALGVEIGKYETENPSNQFADSFDADNYTDIAINGRIGVDIGSNFGAEFEAAFNVGGAAEYSSRQDDGIGGYEAENDVSSRLLVFLRGGGSVSDQVKLFARAGLGATRRQNKSRSYGIYQFDGTSYDETRIYKDTDPTAAFGIGAEYAPNPDSKSSIRTDLTYYSSYIGGEDQDIDSANNIAVSVAFIRRF